MNLAVAQYLSGDYLGAEASYLRVIELVEASGRLTTPRLARAEAGLAATYYAGKRYDLAAQHFDRAVALSRRSEGLFNEDTAATAAEVRGLADANSGVWRMRSRRSDTRCGSSSASTARPACAIAHAARVRRSLVLRGRPLRSVPRRAALKPSRSSKTRRGQRARTDRPADRAGRQCDRASCSTRWPAGISRSATTSGARCSTIRWRRIGPALSASDDRSEARWRWSVPSRSRAPARTRRRCSSPPSARSSATGSSRRTQFDSALPQYQLAWHSATGQSVDGQPADRADLRPSGAAALRATALLGPLLRSDRPARSGTPCRVVELHGRARRAASGPKVVADGGDPRLGALTEKATQSARYRPRFEKGRRSRRRGVRIVQPFLLSEVEDPAPARA